MTPTAADMRELPELPTPGRVVEVRGSTWAVTDVVAQGLLRSPPDASVAGRQHVVALQSLDEDRLGEELQAPALNRHLRTRKLVTYPLFIDHGQTFS